MRNALHILLLFTSWAFALPVICQNDSLALKNSKLFSINFLNGPLWVHDPKIEMAKDKPLKSLELSFVQIGSGSKLWHSFYRFPEFGISYRLIDYGNRDILGYGHVFYTFVNLPVITKLRWLSADLYFAHGLGYISKVYDPIVNPYNFAISTHLNSSTDVGFTIGFHINQALTINTGFRMSHYSNGSYKKPNSGLNYPLAMIGLNYGRVQTQKSILKHYSFKTERNRLIILGTAFTKETRSPGGPTFWVRGLSVEYSRQFFSPLLRYGITWDLMKDDATPFIFKRKRMTWESDWELIKTGLTFNTEFILNRVSLSIQIGDYLYNKLRIKDKEILYQRVNLRYRLSNRFWLNAGLKTHWNVADYIECGIGFKVF